MDANLRPVAPEAVLDEAEIRRAGAALAAAYRRGYAAYEQYLIEPHPVLFPGDVTYTEPDD